MLVSANGLRVLSGEIMMPRVGAWVADLALDAALPVGPCAISVAGGAVTFRGTVVRTNSFRERHTALVVGGAGGLSSYLAHRHHRAVPLETPVKAILVDAGETLSTSSDATTLRQRLTAWSRRAGTAGDALTTLLEDVGASWRVLDDGTVWVGAETWPVLTVAAQTTGDGGSMDSAEVATDLPVVRPGVTLGGRRVSCAIHSFEPARVRTRVLFERAGAMDRLRGAFFGLARQALAAVDYHPSYAATVVTQQGNGDLEVRIDDERFRRTEGGTGIAGAKIWPGVPGISYALKKGTRVLVGFLDGIGKTPIVTGWHSETPERVNLEADRINLGGAASRGVARLNDTVAAGTLTAVAVPPNGVTITYTPPSGAPVVIALAGTGLTVTPANGTITGTISSASSKSFAE